MVGNLNGKTPTDFGQPLNFVIYYGLTRFVNKDNVVIVNIYEIGFSAMGFGKINYSTHLGYIII